MGWIKSGGAGSFLKQLNCYCFFSNQTITLITKNTPKNNKTLNNLYDGVLDITIQNWNPFNSHSFTMVPETNQIVIFPSNLPHKVSTSRSDNERYCIAFNYFVRGIFGKNEGELRID